MNNSPRRFWTACLTVLLLAGASLPVAAQENSQQTTGAHPEAVESAAGQVQGDVLSLINSSTQYSIFASLLQRSGMMNMLAGKGPFTVFVPSNSAFASLPAGALDRLMQPKNKSRLATLVTGHVLPGAIPSAEWNGSFHLGTALDGQALTYQHGQYEQINNAAVVHKDLFATNGVVHVINAPLNFPENLPPSP